MFDLFENPAMAEQRMINQLQMERQRFWYPLNARPPMNDVEREQAIQYLMGWYGHLSMHYLGDAMFLRDQGCWQLLALVQQEMAAVTSTQNLYVSSLQGGARYPQSVGSQIPPPPAPPGPQAAPGAPAPNFSSPDAVREMLDKSSRDQQRVRDQLLGNCIHCHRPLEGNSQCPYCGRYQNT